MSLEPNTKYMYILNPASVEQSVNSIANIDYERIFYEEVDAYHKKIEKDGPSSLSRLDYRLQFVEDKSEILDYMNKASEQFELDVQTAIERKRKEIELENKEKRYSFVNGSTGYKPKNPQNITRESIFSFDAKVKGIAGIIFPISAHDYSDSSDFIDKVKNDYLQERINKEIDKIDCCGHPRTDVVNEKKSWEFYKMFKVPIFEAHKTVPGYRYNNPAVGKVEPIELKSAYVEAGFRGWLKANLKRF